MSKLVGKYLDSIYAQDSGSGDGSTTAFVLTSTPHSNAATNVYLNGVLQDITSDYTLNLGTKTVTFTTAPANGQGLRIVYTKV